MISKNKLKLIKSLARKKFREKENLFLAEGDKTVAEVLKSNIRIRELYATSDFLNSNKHYTEKAEQHFQVTPEELKKASLLREPQNCLAVCEIPPPAGLPQKLHGFSFYLDGIRDPGNLGTIIRTCDWFGVEYLFCSPDTVDVYNPKVIQASMGSFCHLPIIYIDFSAVRTMAASAQAPLLGAFTDGENIYTQQLPKQALIILGNEGQGISRAIETEIQNRLSIPSFRTGDNSAESLNVAVAAAVICSEFRRNSSVPPYSK